MTKNDHWYDVAVKLKDENIAEPILWLGDHNLLSRAKNKFGDEVVKILISTNLNLIKYLG